MNEPIPIEYAAGRKTGFWPSMARPLGVLSCVIGAAATFAPLRPLITFYQVPVGTQMRPMGLTFLLGMCAAVGLFITLPLAAICLVVGWRDRSARIIAIVGIIVSLCAACGGFMLYGWIVRARGFVLLD